MVANRGKKFKSFKEKRPKNKKRARLIVRNLPFSVTEEAFRNHFAPYGSIEEIKLLRKDSKLIGCGFVQFQRKQSAAKAIHHLSGKELLGRPVIVDWAVPKSKFGTLNVPNKITECAKGTEHDEYEPKVPIRHTPKSEENSDSEYELETETESHNRNKQEDDASQKSQDETKPNRTRPADSHDVHEGRTVFLKNVPFNCTNDELKACAEKFGPVFYAVICIDPLTEHSKGTAFVKFKFKEDAIKCLESGSELKLKTQIMEPFPALEKKRLMNQDRDKHPDKKKDTRNLYLIKEGVIIAGTKAAEGVSMSDMKKRLELEVWKNNMLRNLNMFVSQTRLIVHNLPASYDDKMLRDLFKKHAPPKSKIIEAKVMRNLRRLDSNNKPISKGYGFVSFIHHRDALTTLRNVNNNPIVFNKNKRPIVAFSIENRVVHKIKRKRVEKSKLNNALCPESKRPKLDCALEKPQNKLKRRMRSENVPSFAGIEAHPGAVKLPSKRKIAFQEAVHLKNIKETKKEKKRKHFVEETRKEKKRDPKIKSKKNKELEEKEFSKLVEKYRQSMIPNDSMKKWYEAD